MRWTQCIQDALEYIEDNITEEIIIDDIAKHVNMSSFYFQRGFSILCDYPVGEYIRNRKLALAGSEIVTTDIKIIDVALKYGYDSPDSFTKAFTRFHGSTPTAVRKDGASIKAFSPLRIKITLEGGSIMEYKILNKAAFTVLGKSNKVSYDNAYQEIPLLWENHFISGDSKLVVGMYGICLDGSGKEFDYMIAGNYLPWEEIPTGFETKVIPAGTWAVFPCRGALPEAVQEVNTKIWSEWIPNCQDYELNGDYNIELYAPCAEKPEDNYSEIWIPLKKI